MSKRARVNITNDGAKGFFTRAREHARTLEEMNLGRRSRSQLRTRWT